MTTQLTQLICPTCTGYGVLSDADGVITCTTCQGSGVTLQAGPTTLSFSFPEIARPVGPSLRRLHHIMRLTLSVVSFALALASLTLITLHTHALSAILWQRDWYHLVFGLSGLTSMWALAHWSRRQTSKKSLHTLEGELAQKPETLELGDYANPRLFNLLDQAAYMAQQLHAPQVDDAILLLALLEQPRISMMIARLEVPPLEAADALRKQITNRGSEKVLSVSFLPQVRLRVLSAFQKALDHHFPYIDLEDVLLAYAEEPGQFADLFKAYHLDAKIVYATTRWYAAEQERRRQWAFWLERGRSRPQGFMNRAWTALPTPFLDQFSKDITSTASSGLLDGTMVREAEVERALEILGGTQQNSVLLVGEPGSGKTSVLETIALRMVEENVPEVLKDKRLVELDLPSLLSDAENAKENTQHVVDEVAQAGNVILAIPEIQALVGSDASGGLDAASVFANGLKQGALQIISTATFGDYHRYVESNETLSSLLAILELKALSPEQAIDALEEEAMNLEQHHRVFLTYPAIEAAARLAAQYLPDQPLPASGITLLDEAAGRVAKEKRRWVQHTDVEKAVEKRTNVPVQAAGSAEADTLLNLEEQLHTRVVGQEEAIKGVSEALRRARAGLQNPNRPISSFLFVGPTGVGKTETAKALADIYFGSEKVMVRLDMSEYQDPQSINRLIGAPAASSESYTEGGALTQPIREHPFSLILLDELEKAEPQVLNLFLQLLEDGRLTENSGRTVHFNNCIIIATSNAGSTEVVQMLQQGMQPQELQTKVLGLLQQHFKPEFLNRFDAIIPFHALRPGELMQIVRIMVQDVIKKAADQRITLTFSEDALQKLVAIGYDPTYGARPLRRAIQDKAEGLLARLILEGKTGADQALQITAEMLQ